MEAAHAFRPFDLNDLINQVAEDEDLADPHDLSEIVLESIPPHAYRKVLEQTLPPYVGDVVRSQRRRTINRSAKWEQVAQDHKSGALDIHRLRVAMGPKNWKFLGDCTRDDIKAVIEQHTELARQNMTVANRFENLLRLMEEKDAAVVAEIPADEVAKAIRE